MQGKINNPPTAFLKSLFNSLPRRRRLQAIPLLGLMLLSSVAELVTIGAVVPFVAVLTHPEQAADLGWLNSATASFGIAPSSDSLLFFAGLFIGLALLSMLLRLVLNYATQRWALMANYDLSVDLYQRMLSQPFLFHCRHNSSELMSALFKTEQVTRSVIQSALQALVAVALSLGIIAALLLIDPLIALSAGLLFALVYLVISALVRLRLKRGGGAIAEMYTSRIQMLQEGLASIRDVMVDGREAQNLERYAALEYRLKKAQAEAQVLSSAPRYLVETLGIVILVVIAIVLIGQSDPPAAALPVVGALALAAQRLLPQAQQLYASWAGITGNRRIVEDVLKFQALARRNLNQRPPAPEGFGFQNAIRFEQVAFRYPDAAAPVLQGLNFEIRAGSRIGIIGETGAGKSTLVDLILGLLEPTEGRVRIDDTVLDESCRRAWQDRLAHVPQALFLADASIAENIALGEHREDIDLERVRQAAAIARLDKVIQGRPEGIWSRVGERGIALSGGQRQRIGIARALYHQPDVLILDEATNALDEATEREVVANLKRHRPELTLIIVTHRTESLRDCDRYIHIENRTATVLEALPGALSGIHRP